MVDNECDADGWEICKMAHDEITGVCEHKPIFPLKEREFWGFISAMFVLAFANLGGTPGAGLVVPVSILFLKFYVKNAIALSNFSVFLSGFIRYVLVYKKPHPLKDGKGV